MLGPGRCHVNDSGLPTPCRGGEFARPAGARQTGAPSPRPTAVIPILSALLAAALVFAGAWAFSRRQAAGRRQRAVSGILDAADALEERLRTARAEIEAVAGNEQNPVRDAMQEMLRQRLWLQQHAGQAPLQQLDSVRESINHARRRIDQQLLQIERARAPLH